MHHQWNHVGYKIIPNLGQAFATTTLNTVPTLAYEDITHRNDTQPTRTRQLAPHRERSRGRGSGPRNRPNPLEYCSFYHSSSHDTINCRDPPSTPRQATPQGA